MSRRNRRFGFVVAAIAFFLAAGFGAVAPAPAQDEKGAAVNIVTIDGVKLKGHLFESGKKNAATVIMLHPIGEGKSSKAPEWKALAETLQKAGYNVMTFDFRGHGDSTIIEDTATFWSQAVNRNNVRTKNRDEIDVKDYIGSTAYPPVLCNDIAAVKAYLDRKHDAGVGNTSNTIIVGAESGATLGAIWINSEWHRFKLTPPPNMFSKATVAKRPEGTDVVAAVFLSITPELTPKRKVNLTSILTTACKTNGMGATFFYGDKDKAARDAAKLLEKNLITKDKKGEPIKKHAFIGIVEMETDLSGVKLLRKGLKTDEYITRYLDGLISEKANEYVERDYQNALYIWRTATGAAIPSKNKKGERNLLFIDYSMFAQ